MVSELKELSSSALSKTFSIVLVLSALPAIADNIRLVPQPSVTDLLPNSVTFHPTANNTIMIQNLRGRIDILDISNWQKPIKTLEIASSATSAAFSPDGKFMVSGGADGKVRLWNLSSGVARGAPLDGPDRFVVRVAFSRDGKRVVSGGANGNLRLWNVDSDTYDAKSLEGHSGRIVSVMFSPDGKRVLSASSDGTVRSWDVESASSVGELSIGQRDMVMSVAFSLDGTRAVSGSFDGTLRLWDVESGSAIHQPLTGHQDRVMSVAFSPDATRIVSGSYGALRLWDAERGEPIGEPLMGHNGMVVSVAFSPDGTRIVSGSYDGTVRLWDVESGSAIGMQLKELDLEEAWFNLETVVGVGFNPDGTRVVSGSYDGTLRLWDVDSGSAIGQPTANMSDMVESIALSPDGTLVVSGGYDGTVQLWEVDSGEPIGTALDGHDHAVVRVAFSQDGESILSVGVDGTVRLWRLEDGMSVAESLYGHDGPVVSAAFSVDGKRIATGDDKGTVRMWRVDSGEPIGKLLNHDSGVLGLAFSPDGKHIASGTDSAVQLWNVESGSPIGRRLEGHSGWVRAVAFSPDGKRIASGGDDGTVRLWEVESGSPIGAPLEGHGGWVWSVAFSQDSKRVASGYGNGTVRLWSIETGTPVGAPLKGRKNWVARVAFSEDGKRAISSGHDRTVRLWNLQGDTIVSEQLERRRDFVAVAISADGTRVATGSDYADNTVRLWEVESGEPIGHPLSHNGDVSSLAFSADGRRIAAGNNDGTVRLWEVESGEAIGEPLDHADRDDVQVLALAFSFDGQRIVSGGDDGTVRLWEVESGDAIGERLDHVDRDDVQVLALAFSPDGQRVVSGGDDGTVRQWSVGSGEAIGEPLDHVDRDDVRVIALAFSPDAKRFVSGDESGTVRLSNVDGSAEISSKPVCDPHDVSWLSHDVTMIACYDRIIFLDSRLKHRGTNFLLPEGIIAVVYKHGVYASPTLLKDHVLAFDVTGNLGAPKPIPVSLLHQFVLDESNTLSIIVNRIEIVYEWVLKTVVDMHDALSVWAYFVWIAVLWTLTILSVVMMWALFPSRMALLSMPMAGVPDMPSEKALPWKHIVSAITLFGWLGGTRRPMKKWLQRNRSMLEEECFTGRDQVRERTRFCQIREDDLLERFGNMIDGKGRALVWIEGVGGSGKSALGMHLLRKTLIGKPSRPVPVLVGEDWSGSLAAQVARQLRLRNSRRRPTTTMVKTLGAIGLICPLVDSLSERGMTDAKEIVEAAVSNHDFRHLVVTSRKIRPDGHAWETMERVTPETFAHKDLREFIGVYVGEAKLAAIVERRITPLLKRERMPSPLFLRFAITQAECGSLKAIDRTRLVLDYVEALRANRINIQSSDMKRAAAIAAITSFHDRLFPQEFSEQQLLGTVMTECHARSFYDEGGCSEVTPPRLVEMLVRSGLISQGMSRLQFTYDPVAEYLVAWWVIECPMSGLDVLRERIAKARRTGVGSAYRDVTETLGRTRVDN